jgi:hypothetical protein
MHREPRLASRAWHPGTSVDRTGVVAVVVVVVVTTVSAQGPAERAEGGVSAGGVWTPIPLAACQGAHQGRAAVDDRHGQRVPDGS